MRIRNKTPIAGAGRRACGQECWQIVSQWVWNLRLELGQQLQSEPIRSTEFAPALPAAPASASNAPVPAQGYRPAEPGQLWKQGRFSGQDFTLQPDGVLRCPAGKALAPTEQRRERDGTLRVLYAAKIRDGRPCRLRERCQWQGRNTSKPRRVSVLMHPLAVASAPLLWRDWSRRTQRRACMAMVRSQRVEVQVKPDHSPASANLPVPLSRAKRAHWRLSWEERLGRNARAPTTDPVTITLFGVPDAFARFLGLASA